MPLLLYYKVWIKGKWSNAGKVAIEKEAFGLPLTTISQLTILMSDQVTASLHNPLLYSLFPSNEELIQWCKIELTRWHVNTLNENKISVKCTRKVSLQELNNELFNQWC